MKKIYKLLLTTFLFSHDVYGAEMNLNPVVQVQNEDTYYTLLGEFVNSHAKENVNLLDYFEDDALFAQVTDLYNTLKRSQNVPSDNLMNEIISDIDDSKEAFENSFPEYFNHDLFEDIRTFNLLDKILKNFDALKNVIKRDPLLSFSYTFFKKNCDLNTFLAGNFEKFYSFFNNLYIAVENKETDISKELFSILLYVISGDMSYIYTAYDRDFSNFGVPFYNSKMYLYNLVKQDDFNKIENWAKRFHNNDINDEYPISAFFLADLISLLKDSEDLGKLIKDFDKYVIPCYNEISNSLKDEKVTKFEDKLNLYKKFRSSIRDNIFATYVFNNVNIDDDSDEYYFAEDHSLVLDKFYISLDGGSYITEDIMWGNDPDPKDIQKLDEKFHELQCLYNNLSSYMNIYRTFLMNQKCHLFSLIDALYSYEGLEKKAPEDVNTPKDIIIKNVQDFEVNIIGIIFDFPRDRFGFLTSLGKLGRYVDDDEFSTIIKSLKDADLVPNDFPGYNGPTNNYDDHDSVVSGAFIAEFLKNNNLQIVDKFSKFRNALYTRIDDSLRNLYTKEVLDKKSGKFISVVPYELNTIDITSNSTNKKDSTAAGSNKREHPEEKMNTKRQR